LHVYVQFVKGMIYLQCMFQLVLNLWRTKAGVSNTWPRVCCVACDACYKMLLHRYNLNMVLINWKIYSKRDYLEYTEHSVRYKGVVGRECVGMAFPHLFPILF